MEIIHRTTREHYEKYEELAKRAHVTLLTDNEKFLGILKKPCRDALDAARDPERGVLGCMGCWLCMYRLDPYLNSVPLRKWDLLVHNLWVHQGRKVVTTLNEGINMYKHLVIYQIVGAVPHWCPDCEGRGWFYDSAYGMSFTRPCGLCRER